MTAILFDQEFAASKNRFQRTLGISIALHIALFAWLTLRQHVAPINEGLVKISWLEPVPVPIAPAPVPKKVKPAPVKAVKPVAPSPVEEKFQRQTKPAVVEPTPQEKTANRDKVKERMAALSTTRPSLSAMTTTSNTSRSLLKSAPVQATDLGQKAPAVDLKRSANARTSPTVLKRVPTKTKRSAPALAPLRPAQTGGAAAAMPDMDSVARRTLSGAELAGEIANRPVVEHAMPIYPDWAKSQAVEATVTLYFVVLPDGRVKENIQIQKTAGFADFDQSAMSALAKWRFQALSGGAAHEQWGTITFRFRLRN